MDTDWQSRTKYSEGGSQDSRQVCPPWKGWSSNYTKGVERIRHYRPEILVQEDCAGHRSRRCPRIQRLLDQIRTRAVEAGVKSRSVSLEQVRRVFLTFGAEAKHQIAQAIAGQLPELAQHLPRFRKPWMSEDYRMAIFDAVAQAPTYFCSRPLRSRETPAPLSS